MEAYDISPSFARKKDYNTLNLVSVRKTRWSHTDSSFFKFHIYFNTLMNDEVNNMAIHVIWNELRDIKLHRLN